MFHAASDQPLLPDDLASGVGAESLRALRVPFVVAAAIGLACAHVPSPQDRELAENHHDIAVHAMSNGRPQEALKEYQKALALNPGLAEAHQGLGLIYQWSYGRLTDARREYETALALKPAFSEAANNLGVLLAELGDYAQARVLFEQALADPLYATPYIAQTNLGWVLHSLGRSPAGEATVRAALGARPDYCVGHRQLARILEAQGRAEEAEPSWEKFAKYCPDEPDALYRRGLLDEKYGRPREAMRAYTKCLQRAGERAVAGECRAGLRRLPPMEPDPELPPDSSRTTEGARDLESKKTR
jgi:type IV pilus biogenesis/stability protein PilW